MKKHILVVDDEPDIREMLADLLEEESYEVFMAPSAAAGLELISQLTYIDLAIVDYMMPGGDGLTLIQGITEGGYDVPTILYSAYMLDTNATLVVSKAAPPTLRRIIGAT